MHSMSQRAIAETFGTAALVLVGPGSVIATLTLAAKAVAAVPVADPLPLTIRLAGLVIGGAVVGTSLVFGPITGASLTPARAFGPELVQAIAGGTTFWTQYVPVYLIPGLVGAAGASFLYDFLANPRLVERPIIEAVTHEETRTAAAH